jgi:tetratricopeptide (TPR) repeat protein
MAPNNPFCWGNLGNLEHEMYRFDEAEFCFEKGLSVSNNDQQKAFLYLVYSAMLVQKGDWDRALPMCRKAFAYKDKAKTRANLGLALLATGDWKEGWPLYDAIIGFDKSRRKMQYANEAEWDGSKGKTVVIYEEQGVGDAISFASMVPDAIKDCKKVIIDCSPKLAGLFRRSFPQADVYGSLGGSGEDWRPKYQIDASISLGGLGKLYRPTPESCPGTPYLIPDPDRVRMWRALFDKKPVIGIAWSGGLEHTGALHRAWKLGELLPLFKSVNATWVSLQYKDAEKEIAEFKVKHPEIDLRQYSFGTLTRDYDDTAALVESLDMVISMQTAVIHLAGSMGKECWCFVNKHGQWRYGPNTQKTLPWYESVRLFRNVNGWPIGQAALELKDKWRTSRT